MQPFIYCSILFVISVISIQENNAQSGYNLDEIKSFTKEELEVLQDSLKKQSSRFLTDIQGSVKCHGLQCDLCVDFEWAKNPHELCLTAGLNPEQLGIFIDLGFDADNIWRHEFNFNKICTGLPKPLNKIEICLEAYNVSVMSLPNEAAICFRSELTLLFPILSVDFNCIKYQKGKGVFFDWSIESPSKALVDVNINGGKPIVSFNSPIPKELFQPIVNAINDRRTKLGLALFLLKLPWINVLIPGGSIIGAILG